MNLPVTRIRDYISIGSLVGCAVMFAALHLLFLSPDLRNTPMSDYGVNGGWSQKTFDLMLFSQAVYFVTFSPTYSRYSKPVAVMAALTAVGPLLVAVYPQGDMHLLGVAWLFLGIMVQVLYAKYKLRFSYHNRRKSSQALNMLFWVMIAMLGAFLAIEIPLNTDANRGLTQRLFVLSSMIWLTVFTVNLHKFHAESAKLQ